LEKMTTTFYLKYRPQKLSELDSTEAREELEKIFKSGKPPHALLFSGPKGIGKTSAARIVAKAVNCDELSKGEYEPCNKCANCISITNGTNVDVLEIDAASNRGIDDIKELREKIKLSPSSLKYKVYIIDEVHMLTTEAFNALLKTLEEPPKHAIFVLCTTDPEKLPKTITSRCLIVNFKRATPKEIIERLKKICVTEKLEFEEQALTEIAKLSDGSFRDANKVLEQVSFSGKITESGVEKIIGVSREFNLEDFLLMLQKRQTKEALIWINKATTQSVNLKILIESLLDKLRNLLLLGFGLKEEPAFAEASTDAEAMADKSASKVSFSREEILFLINLFTKAYSELRFAVIPQLPLEMAVIEWGETKGGDNVVSCESGYVSEDEEKTGNLDTQPITQPRHTTHNPQQNLNFTLENVLSKWPEILEKVKPLNHSVQAFLRATRPIACEDGFLILEVFYKFHKDQLEKDQCRKIFEKVASEVLGSNIKMKCNLSEVKREPPPPPVSQNFEEADIMKLAEEIFNKGTIQ